MANKVKVFNLNHHPLNEIFKGDEVLIEPQDYWRDKKGQIKEIDIYEANDFKGQYHPVPADGSGKMVNDPKHYKMIRLEPIAEQKKNENPHDMGVKCMVTGCLHISPSPEELEAHNKVRHADQPVSQGTAEGPLGLNPSANATRPIFRQNEPSQGKEEAPSTRKRTG